MTHTPSTDPDRILLTGATGVVGRRLVPALVAAGHTVYALSRSPEAARAAQAMGAVPLAGDALDRDAVFAAMAEARPGIVVHHATAIPTSGFNPRRVEQAMATTNALRVHGTRHLVDAAEAHGAQRLIAQSIAFAYAHEGPEQLDETAPLDLRGPNGWDSVAIAVSRLEETVMSAKQVQGMVLRFGGFYGPGTAVGPGGMVARLVARRRMPVIGDGRGQTPMIHVDDVVGATLDALDAGWGVYNIVDDVPAPAREWIPALAEALGAPPPRRIPAWVARALAGEHTVRVMTTQRGALNAKAKAELGFRPQHPDWREGFRAMARGETLSEPAARA